MNTGCLSLDFFLLMLIVDKPWVYGDEADNCTTVVNVKRNSEFRGISGQPAIIECPVTYCQEQPEMKWYMYDTMYKKFSILNLGRDRTASWIKGNIFVLNFSSINTNDSGLYHCEASVDKYTIQGHAINVTVQGYRNIPASGDDKNSTGDGGQPEKDKMMMMIYILSSLGSLGLLIFCSFGLLQFTQRHQVKNRTTSSALQIEMNEVNSYKNVKCCNDTSGHVSREASFPPLQEFPDGSAVCSNQSNHKKAKRAASKPTQDKSVTKQLLPANQDTLVYATLNHGEHFPRSKPFVETECIEYATIVLKN